MENEKKKPFARYAWEMMKIYYPKTAKWTRIGIGSLAGLAIITSICSLASRDKVYSGIIKGMKIEYIENAGFFSGKNAMKVEKWNTEYEFFDYDMVDLDWNKAYSEYNEADLEKVVMKKKRGQTYTFTLKDIDSEKLKNLYAKGIFEKSNRDYNVIRMEIYNKLRKEYDSEISDFKSGLDDIDLRMAR